MPTKAFIAELQTQDCDSSLGKIVDSIHGGENAGTWVCKELALKLAALISPTLRWHKFAQLDGTKDFIAELEAQNCDSNSEAKV